MVRTLTQPHRQDLRLSAHHMSGRHLRPVRLFLAVGALSFALILALSGIWTLENWAHYDQLTYHLPYVNLLIERGLDPFGPSLSATTPGVHLLHAALALVSGEVPLQPQSWLIPVAGSAIAALTLACLAVCHRSIARNWAWSPLLLLPVLSSQYFILAGAYLVTEGLGYLFLCVFLLMARPETRPEPYPQRRQWFAAAALAGLVLTRQIYLPAAMVMLLALMAVAARPRPAGRLQQALLVMLPALAFLPFLLHWKGLVPPGFAVHKSSGLNLPAMLQSIALLGLLALPLLPALWRAGSKCNRAIILLAVALALLPMLFAATDFNTDAGRFGSLVWTLSRAESAMTGLSLLIYILFAAGAFVLGHALVSGVHMVGLAALGYITYSAALCFQLYAWQRYSEVFALILISLFAATLLPRRPRHETIIFTGFFAIWFAATLAMRAGG